MKLITRDTDYAIRALRYIAKHKNKKVSASDLAKRLKMPRSFLRKILQILNKKKILSSSKGVGGGFILLKDPGKLFIVDLIKIFQGSIKLNECTFKKKLCPDKKNCTLTKKIDSIEKNVASELNKITLKSLLN